ncbi:MULTISPECIES: disulfide bond formation protein B [Bradyrhizobium]|uniref:Disulfide bond formation protein B n=1 Tax=Bradyrhizobium arachidis TaxID=858423 RepID=A0AAE7NKA3_9BRAD|nr:MULTISPECIES: disulfide bond formation protein B [Bradyrhizobium]QOG22197.1 disulfide bond formation protein B [Bradyrhizobium sp. SEMIA]QOZ66882.1 disulfide bond formation protein B [Bradyrhizobium arachidis]UFW51579.1 disulfide bond formation protein B [Bradyrhizobium arachidis]SFV13572.1 Disulfide bond formation protein DsbB [Bradyrhizobium arachidis]
MGATEVSGRRSVGAILNMLGLLGISLILAVAFFYQLALGELPCPLCLLQRAGFIAIGMGFLFNMRLGERPSHYAMILIASLVTGFISMRQVSLHLAPGDPGYGSTLLGLHFYTWALIAAVGIVCYVALVFVLKDVTDDRDGAVPLNGPASNAVFAIFAVLVAANLLSTVLECGAGQCDDNPVRYLLLK